MRIVLATPLFPPDTGEVALYAKQAAKRLSDKHSVTVVAYGHLPEKVPGAQIVTVSKKNPILSRIISYTLALIRESKRADVIYLQNGPSIELPAVIATLVSQKPMVFHIADAAAHGRARKSWPLWFTQGLAHNHAQKTFADMPLPKPEILPFEPYPEEAFAKYEASWREHLGTLERIFRHE